MKPKPDRRVRRTRKMIQNALFSLMQQMPYDKIRISQITEVADIARSTFYYHYDTKEDLLLSVADEIIDEYFKTIDEVIRGSNKSPTRLLFSKWKQNLDVMKLILEAGMEFRIYQRLRMFNAQRTESDITENSLLDDYIRTMLDGACFALLLRWTKDEAIIPVDQMAQLFTALNISHLFTSLETSLPGFGAEGPNKRSHKPNK